MRLTEVEFARQKQLNISALKPDERSQVMATWFKRDDGSYQVLSVVGDNVWKYPTARFPSQTLDCDRKCRFNTLPQCFVSDMQVLWWAYDISRQPRGKTLIQTFSNIKIFLSYLSDMHVTRLSQINAMHCANYVTHCRQLPGRKGNKTLSSTTLTLRFLGVETLWEITRDTEHQFAHPWTDSSAKYLSGETGQGKSKTLIIPDEQLKLLMQGSMKCVEQANNLLSLRDEIGVQRAQLKAQGNSSKYIPPKLNLALKQTGYNGTLSQFNSEVKAIQTACMIVILTLSGIRVHELGYLKNDAWYFTEDDEGEKTYWMKGRSDKTGEGNCEWLIPKAVTKALDVAQAYAAPLQMQWLEQRQALQTIDLDCTTVYAMTRHENALFLDVSQKNNNRVGGFGQVTILRRINAFARLCGVATHLTPHQFRRSFAVAVGKSVYGDLRYLRQHLKHWSLDMTILYMLNDKQDAELYDQIMATMVNENVERVAHWLEDDTLLSGGSAQQIKAKAGQVLGDGLIHLVIPSVFDPSLAPEGKQLVLASIMCPPDPEMENPQVWWDQLDDTIAEIWPEFREHIEYKETFSIANISAATRDHVLPGQGGECIGLGQIVGQCGQTKPSAGAPVRGLFYVGADAGGYSCGTHQAVDSAFNVARQVLQYHQTH